jgi:hypothetical protein
MGVLETIKAGAYGALGAFGASLIFWLFIIPIKEDAARKGYVVEARATAAEAKLLEAQRQITAGNIVISSYQEIAKNAKAAEAQTLADAELRNQQYEKVLRDAGRACTLNDADLDFLRQP